MAKELTHNTLPDHVKFGQEDDIPDEALASDEAYEAAIAAINNAVDDGDEFEETGDDDPPAGDPPAPSDPATKVDDPPATPPADPSKKEDPPAATITPDELAFFKRYDVTVDEATGLIDGKYKTASEFFAANRHLRTFVGKRTVDVLKDDPTLLAEYLQSNPDVAKNLLSQFNIQQPPQPSIPTPPQAGGSATVPPSTGHLQDTPPGAGSAEAPKSPEEAVDIWVNRLLDPSEILRTEFAERLAAKGINEFPKDEQEWEDFADANPNLAQDIKLRAMAIGQQRQNLRAYGLQLVGQHFEARRGVEAHNRQVYEQDLKSLTDTFGMDQAQFDDHVIDLMHNKPELVNDPRYFEDSLGVVRLRPGAIRTFILENNAEMLAKAVEAKARAAAAEEANEFYRKRAQDRGKPLPTGITNKLGSPTTERNGQHVQLPSAETWKDRAWMSMQSEEDLDLMEDMITKLPPAERAAYY